MRLEMSSYARAKDDIIGDEQTVIDNVMLKRKQDGLRVLHYVEVVPCSIREAAIPAAILQCAVPHVLETQEEILATS